MFDAIEEFGLGYDPLQLLVNYKQKLDIFCRRLIPFYVSRDLLFKLVSYLLFSRVITALSAIFVVTSLIRWRIDFSLF